MSFIQKQCITVKCEKLIKGVISVIQVESMRVWKGTTNFSIESKDISGDSLERSFTLKRAHRLIGVDILFRSNATLRLRMNP
jgi:hypothetical protein